MRWLHSLYVQLFLWAVMPVTFAIIAISFTGVYSHQQTMRDFVAARDGGMAHLLAQVAADGVAHGLVGGDGSGLGSWMAFDRDTLPGDVMVIDGSGRVLAHVSSGLVGSDMRGAPGILEALAQRNGSMIVQDARQPMLATFASVDGTDWTVVIREPVRDLLGPVLRFPSLIPVVAGGAGILSLLILLFGWRTIVRPLQQLARSAGEVSWGKYESIERPIRGVQEVRDLRQALAEMVDRIRGYEAGVRDYLGAVTRGQETERARLARELHDGPVQGLIALGQRAEMAQRLVRRGNAERAMAQLEDLRHTGQSTVQELRRMIGDLRPVYLEDLGFAPALQMLVRQYADRAEAEIHLDIEECVPRLAPDVELAAYRIAQEALNNALYHAQARHITVRTRCDQQTMVLVVADDGVGFEFPDQPSVLTNAGHFGLLGMQERATQLGGRLQVRTASGEGTRVIAHLPGRPDPE